MTKKFSSFGLARVAVAVPTLRLADISYNVGEIIKLARQADKKQVRIVVFPELSVTGYTLGDLFHQRLLLKESLTGLKKLLEASKTIKSALVVGLPWAHEDKIFNVAAVMVQGKIIGLVPKIYLPNYKEFYEKRWFASGSELKAKEVSLLGQKVPVGTDLLFQDENQKDLILGLEICEDLWVPIPPSSFQVLHGATIIGNLSASNDLVAKSEYRRALVAQQSARGVCSYLYASAGTSESTTDLVYGGHALIAENGIIIKETEKFERTNQLLLADIDLEHLKAERERLNTFGENCLKINQPASRVISLPTVLHEIKFLECDISPAPFVPKIEAERDKRVEEIFSIQTAGLAKRLTNSGLKNIIIGISGGLDSTLALLVAVRTCSRLGISLKNIHAFSLPGFATSRRTKNNAALLAKKMGIDFETIDITDGCRQHFKELKHDGKKQDIAYQNVQARYRTMILMNKANQLNGLVLGTGDLSEIALGWCTFNADQISHYNVNCSLPKTLIQYVIKWVSEQPDFSMIKKVLIDILETPISPELVTAKRGQDFQATENLIGPYELHDFFLYHFVRWASEPAKIKFLAQAAFAKKYSPATIERWLKVFLTRFFNNQWKRSVMPDGPKVGSVSLSPRGDWRMPSDAEKTLWLNNL